MGDGREEAVKLTAPQREELTRLAGGRQPTYGRTRARVQNSLMRLRLATFCDANGKRRDLSILEVVLSYGNPHEYCEITDAGRAALKPYPKPTLGKEAP